MAAFLRLMGVDTIVPDAAMSLKPLHLSHENDDQSPGGGLSGGTDKVVDHFSKGKTAKMASRDIHSVLLRRTSPAADWQFGLSLCTAGDYRARDETVYDLTSSAFDLAWADRSFMLVIGFASLTAACWQTVAKSVCG